MKQLIFVIIFYRKTLKMQLVIISVKLYIENLTAVKIIYYILEVTNEINNFKKPSK